MIVALCILLILMLAGMPIYLSILACAVYLLSVVSGVTPTLAITSMFDGVNKFTLTAIPFFMLCGSFMQRSSMTKRLVGCITPWFSNIRGGIGIAGVVTNEIFGAMSGSAPAAAATIGRALYKPVAEENGEEFSLGLFTSCGALAIIMPPSICMILFACATNVSIGKLFSAGVIPALITGVAISAFIIIKSNKSTTKDSKESKFDLHECLRGLKRGWTVLLLPVIILGGIYAGAFSATEAGAVAAAYSLFLPLICYHEFSIKDIIFCIKETAVTASQILVLCSISTILSQALALAQIPTMVAQALSGLHAWQFLLLLNLLLLIVGCFFDTASAVLLLAPVIYPVASSLGVDPIHLGIIVTFNLAIGMFTPPFGLNIFVIQSLFKAPLTKIIRGIAPFFFLYLVILILITYIPQISTWLPSLIG